MHSKKDLMRSFGISHMTVRRTLKICGLSTSKSLYSDEEIKEYFEPARTLFKSGYTTEKVQEYFEIKRTKNIPPDYLNPEKR